MPTGTGEPRLHLVGDAEAAGGPDVAISLGQIAGWKHDLPGHAGQALGQEGPGRVP